MSLYEDLYEETRDNDSPFFAHWELTASCNLACGHCYQPRSRGRVDVQGADLVIRCLREYGFLSVVLSGGEPISHPAFTHIYESLRASGFLVTVCTNGVLIDERVIELFRELPPWSLELSIYGADAGAYERVSNRDSFPRFERAIARLSESGVSFMLKVPLMRSNIDAIDDLEHFAAERGIPLQVGTLIYPRLDGDLAPLSERLPLEQVLEYESRGDRREPRAARRAEAAGSGAPSGLRCASGRNTVVIEPTNRIAFCGMLREPTFGFSTVAEFGEALRSAANLRAQLERQYAEGPCGRCDIRGSCYGCPAQSFLHTGSHTECVRYLRDLALAKNQTPHWSAPSSSA